MMKTLKKTALSLMTCTALLFMVTACAEEKAEDTRPAAEVVAGNYNGTTTYKINGTDPGQIPTNAKIKIEKSGEKLKLTLVESAYGEMLKGAVIAVDNVSVAGTNGSYTLSGSSEVAIGTLKVPITVSGGGPVNKMELKLNVKMTERMAVDVLFNGAKE